MRQAAAKSAAHADRIMRDVARDKREQFAERIIDDRFVERGVAHAGADRQNFSVAHDAIEAGDVIDVDEVGGLGQPERHDRHQALAARQHAAILRRDLGKDFQRFIERARHVADERRWLHAANRLASGG